MKITPGDRVMVSDRHVGGCGSGIPRECLVVAAGPDAVRVRTRRFPTHAEEARGGYDPWTKRVWRLKPDQVDGPAPSQEATRWK